MQNFKSILGVAAAIACAGFAPGCDDTLSSGGADAGDGGSTGGANGGSSGGTPGGADGGNTGGAAGGSAGGSSGGTTGGSSGGSSGGTTGGATGGTTGGTITGGTGGSGGQRESDAGADLGSGCVPAEERCDGVDNDCDGVVDNAGAGPLTEVCYEGAPETQGQAPCREGSRTCRDGSWGACEGQVLPVPEICDLVDNDCNGTADNIREGSCACVPGTEQDCYGGPAGTQGQGSCVAGRQACALDGAAWGACEGQVQPTDERCDGRDEDCDGLVDDGLPGLGEACSAGLGQCAAVGMGACDPALGVVVCDARAGVPTVEVCNGEDDDCNGLVDDGLGVGDACEVGLGDCHAQGTFVCNPASGAVACDALPGEATPERCDGVDNDCDGTVDDGNPGGGGGCDSGRPGACAAGTLACEGGALTCAALLTPGEEQCNALDDDCDGQSDEDDLGAPLTETCYTGPAGTAGIGACQPGRFTCLGGAFGACVGQGLPGLEVCNGIDDDCNGQIDDAPGVGDPCSLGQGICEAAGVVLCDADAGTLYCNAAPGNPRAERCNGLDDDCNGSVDDVDIRVGVMGGSFYTDDARAYLDGLPNVTAVVNEQCDPAALAEFDALLLYGNMSCFDAATFSDYVDGGGGLIATPWALGNYGSFDALPVADAAVSEYNTALRVRVVDPVSPLLTLVNFAGGDGLCDGSGDVPYVGDVDCVAYNAPITLRPGAHLVASHDAVPGGIAIADWDFGGGHAVYLDFHYITSDTALAVVHPWGRQLLRNAVELVSDCSVGPQLACPPGSPGPAPEACNGVDDDCDGTIDNSAGLGEACTAGLGQCLAAGVTICDPAAQAVVCSARPGPTQPERCDGLDNDCDGNADEENPGSGLACETGVPGQCAAGRTSCDAGRIICVQSNQPVPELCDARDNNCDGRADEGNPGGGQACPTGQPGICGAGTSACANGAVRCNQTLQARAEACNGLDDDCNGVVDNGVCNQQVGQFSVNQGPAWGDNPPSYSCVEACALLFGGGANQYHCSTTNGVLNNRAHVSGWGDGQYCVGATVAEGFKSPAPGGYNCGSAMCSYSAYVADHCGADAVNYCWR